MLKVQYDEMIEANCRNCDKFFHCQGNYNAAIGCGKTDNNKRIAKKCESWRSAELSHISFRSISFFQWVIAVKQLKMQVRQIVKQIKQQMHSDEQVVIAKENIYAKLNANTILDLKRATQKIALKDWLHFYLILFMNESIDHSS